MRKGSPRRDWTTGDIAYLMDTAGRIPRRDICRELKRSNGAVKMASKRLGLSLRCHIPRLVWCDECASWRSHVDARTGKCRVCSMRDRIAGREDACSDALAAMTPAQRAVYEESESLRQTRRQPTRPKPQKRESCPVSRYERSKAEADWLLAIEQWEYKRLELVYNAAKTRLRRMREVTGTNPRKKSE